MFKNFRKTYQTLNTVQIDAAALRNNLKLFRKLLPKQAICPVLKSNAYGHGLIEIASILDKENAEFFVVDSLYEAYKLKKAKIKTPILILGYTFPENLKKGLPFHFTAGDIQTAHKLTKLKLPIHIEVDTGMARSGFPMKGIKGVFEELRHINSNIVGLFSHFADADNAEDQSYNKEQCKRFRRAIKLAKETGIEPKWIHAGNTAGSIKEETAKLNMARIGIGLYGISPLEKTDKKEKDLKALKTVIKVNSTIIAIRKLKKGDTVSYNRKFTAPKDMTIGVLAFGYHEGLPRKLSNVPPFIGNICMNHSIIDLNGIDPIKKDPKIGDTFTIYNENLVDFAKKANTIPYELIVRIDPSIRREIV